MASHPVLFMDGGNVGKGSNHRRITRIREPYQFGALWSVYRQAAKIGDWTEADKVLLDLYRRWEEGRTGSSQVMEITENAQGGVFSGELDPRMDYRDANIRPIFVKRAQIELARQAHRDWMHISERGHEQNFRLSPVERPSEYPQEGFALYPTQIIVGPTVSNVFRALNYLVSKGNSEAQDIKRLLIDKRLEDLAWWATHMHEAVPQEARDKLSMREEVISMYKRLILGSFETAAEFSYRDRYGFKLSELEKEILTKSLRLYELLNLENGRTVRIRDDTDGNSGIELHRMEFDDIGQLASAVFEALTFEQAGVRKASRDNIERLLAHWDTSVMAFGSVEDDFVRVIDSASADIPESQKDMWHMLYLQRIFQDRAGKYVGLIDYPLIRAERNLRQRDVAISGFAARNEQRYDAGAISKKERDQKRHFYTRNSKHYANSALRGLEAAMDYYSSQLQSEPTPTEYPTLMRSFKKAKRTLAAFPIKESELNAPLSVINGAIDLADPRLSGLASAMGLYIIVAKTAKYHQIDFDSLPKIH